MLTLYAVLLAGQFLSLLRALPTVPAFAAA